MGLGKKSANVWMKTLQPFRRDRPPGAVDPRVKSSGHKRKTADKWNQ